MPSGRLVMPTNDVAPKASDIAHNLCRQARFNGSAPMPYSVMQHSLVVAAQMPPHLRWAGLLHDAPEAVMGDVVRPWKPKEFSEREVIILDRILKSFGLPLFADWPDEVNMSLHEADMMAACAEAILLFGEDAREWCKPWVEPTEQIMRDTQAMLPMIRIWYFEPSAAWPSYRRALMEALEAWKVYVS